MNDPPVSGGDTTAEQTWGAGGASGIRRQRASYSCQQCRARRVKCDQVNGVTVVRHGDETDPLTLH